MTPETPWTIPGRRHTRTILYDGETIAYSSGEAWDGNSSISESTTAPYSAPNHIRGDVVTSNNWGAVVYYFYSRTTKDWTGATRLSMQAKGDSAVSVPLALVYSNSENFDYGSAVTLELTNDYQAFDIDISQDVDPTRIAGIILYNSRGQFAVDLDDIVLTIPSSPL